MSRVDFTENDTSDPNILEGTWVSVCYPVELDGTPSRAIGKRFQIFINMFWRAMYQSEDLLYLHAGKDNS